MKDIVEELQRGTHGWARPRWVRKILNVIKKSYKTNEWAKLIFQTIFPARHDKVRFQVVVETKDSVFQRPFAIRAASDHAAWSILDPSRVANGMPTSLFTLFPALFHVMDRSNINMIMRDGLRPGYQLDGQSRYKRGRSDLHFSPFPPFDHRGQYFEKKGMGMKLPSSPSTQDFFRVVSCCVFRLQMDTF